MRTRRSRTAVWLVGFQFLSARPPRLLHAGSRVVLHREKDERVNTGPMCYILFQYMNRTGSNGNRKAESGLARRMRTIHAISSNVLFVLCLLLLNLGCEDFVWNQMLDADEDASSDGTTSTVLTIEPAAVIVATDGNYVFTASGARPITSLPSIRPVRGPLRSAEARESTRRAHRRERTSSGSRMRLRTRIPPP